MTTKNLKSFTNEAGQVFGVHGMSPLQIDLIRAAIEREWKEGGRELPSIPVYTVILADGTSESHQHDTTTLETDADRAAWEKYHREAAEIENLKNVRMLNACFLCVDVDPMKDDAWKEEMELLGIQIPERSSERKLLYGQTRVITSLNDSIRLASAVMALSGMINEEQAAAAENSFRGHMEGKDEVSADPV